MGQINLILFNFVCQKNIFDLEIETGQSNCGGWREESFNVQKIFFFFASSASPILSITISRRTRLMQFNWECRFWLIAMPCLSIANTKYKCRVQTKSTENTKWKYSSHLVNHNVTPNRNCCNLTESADFGWLQWPVSQIKYKYKVQHKV